MSRAGGDNASVDGLPIETWLDVCLSDIHAAVEVNLPRLVGSRLQDRDLLEGVLGYTPPPELQEALKLMAEAPERSALRMGLGRILIATAILVQRELCALTEPRRLEMEMLRRQAETVPALTRRVEALEADILAMRQEGSADADRLRKLRVSLIPSLPRLQGFATLVSRVLRLATAAIDGTLSTVEGLTPAEISWFEAATGRGTQQQPLVPRVLLDAVALRIGLQEDLERHWEGNGREGHLRSAAAAHDMVVERLRRAVQDPGPDAMTGRLSAVQQELSPLHRKLSAILRGAGVSAPPPQAKVRRFRQLIAAALLLPALAALLFLLLRPAPDESAGPTPAPAAETANAVPLEIRFTSVEREGDALVAEILDVLWRRMTPEEQLERVLALRSVAERQGASQVRIIDGTHRELASWSRGGSIRIE